MKLTPSEKNNLEKFIQSVGKPITPVKYSFLYSSVMMVIGLLLLISAMIITLNNLNDKTVYFVLLPGMIGGIVAILVGMYIFRYFRKYEHNQKIVTVMKKLIE